VVAAHELGVTASSGTPISPLQFFWPAGPSARYGVVTKAVFPCGEPSIVIWRRFRRGTLYFDRDGQRLLRPEGWSCHFEFFDDKRRRIRCDFVSRPPRIPSGDLDTMFSAARGEGALRVVDPERLVLLKQTQRAKDYPVIGELARLLPPQSERELTTDPDRILELAMEPGGEGGTP
jgi:hypothetical protein